MHVFLFVIVGNNDTPVINMLLHDRMYKYRDSTALSMRVDFTSTVDS